METKQEMERSQQADRHGSEELIDTKTDASNSAQQQRRLQDTTAQMDSSDISDALKEAHDGASCLPPGLSHDAHTCLNMLACGVYNLHDHNPFL